MADLLSATLGGSVAFTLAALAQALAVPNEVRLHNADAADRDDSLSTWVADRHYALQREMDAIRAQARASPKLMDLTALDAGLAAAKGRVLHEYRDEERRARLDLARIRAGEGWMDRVWRRVRRKPFPTLTTPEKAVPVLEQWRAPSRETEHPADVEDATTRTLDEALRGTL